MELDKFTKEELDELFEASFKVKEIMERYDNWRNLILDNQIYRHNFLLVQLQKHLACMYQQSTESYLVTRTNVEVMHITPTKWRWNAKSE